MNDFNDFDNDMKDEMDKVDKIINFSLILGFLGVVAEIGLVVFGCYLIYHLIQSL